MEGLAEDALLHVTETLSFENILNFCNTSKQFERLCATAGFWAPVVHRDALLVEPDSSLVNEVINEVMQRRKLTTLNRSSYIEILTLLGDVMIGSQHYIPLKYAVYRAGLLGYDDILEQLLEVEAAPQLFPLVDYATAGKFVRMISQVDIPHRLRPDEKAEDIIPTQTVTVLASILTLDISLLEQYIDRVWGRMGSDTDREEAEERLARAAVELLYDPYAVRGEREGERLASMQLKFVKRFLNILPIDHINISEILEADVGEDYNEIFLNLFLERDFISTNDLSNMVRGPSSLWLIDAVVPIAEAAQNILKRHLEVDAVFILSYIMQRYERDAIYDLLFQKSLTVSQFQVLEKVFSSWLWKPAEYVELLLLMDENTGLVNMPAVGRYVYQKTGLAQPPPDIEGKARNVLLRLPGSKKKRTLK